MAGANAFKCLRFTESDAGGNDGDMETECLGFMTLRKTVVLFAFDIVPQAVSYN